MKWKTEFDPRAYQRHVRSFWRKRWREAAHEYTRFGIGGAVCGLALVGAAMHYWAKYGTQAGLLTGVIGGSVIVVLYKVSEAQWQRERVMLRSSDHTLTLEIRDEGIGWEEESGISGVIPWSELSIAHETPEAFTLEYGKDLWSLMRKPMQDAGLEAEFLRRISAAEMKTGGELG